MQRRCPQYDYVTLDTCSDLSYYLCKLHQFRQILECTIQFYSYFVAVMSQALLKNCLNGDKCFRGVG